MGLVAVALYILFSYGICLLTALPALLVGTTETLLELHRHAAGDFGGTVSPSHRNLAKRAPAVIPLSSCPLTAIELSKIHCGLILSNLPHLHVYHGNVEKNLFLVFLSVMKNLVGFRKLPGYLI